MRTPTVKMRDSALASWAALNAYLLKLPHSSYARDLLQREQAGAARPTYIHRIAARFRRLRDQEERKAL